QSVDQQTRNRREGDAAHRQQHGQAERVPAVAFDEAGVIVGGVGVELDVAQNVGAGSVHRRPEVVPYQPARAGRVATLDRSQRLVNRAVNGDNVLGHAPPQLELAWDERQLQVSGRLPVEL